MHFRTLRQLAEQAKAAELSIGRYMLQEQAGETGKTPEEEFRQMAAYYGIMKDAVRRGLTEDTTSRSGLTGQDAKRAGELAGEEELEAHVARVTGGRRPHLGVSHRVHDRAVAARALAEHAPAPEPQQKRGPAHASPPACQPAATNEKAREHPPARR